MLLHARNGLLKIAALVTFLLAFSTNIKGQQANIEIDASFFPDTLVLDSTYSDIPIPVINTGDTAYSGSYGIYFRTNNVRTPKRIDTGIITNLGPNDRDTFESRPFTAESQTYGGGNDVAVIWPELENQNNVDSSETNVYFRDSNANSMVIPKSSQATIELYPNPTGQKLHWNIKSPKKTLDHVRILTPAGKVLEKIAPATPHISLKPYSKGTYVIELIFRDGTQVSRLVVKN